MTSSLSRRELLKWFSAGAGAATIGGGVYFYDRSNPSSVPSTANGPGTVQPSAVGSTSTSSAPALLRANADPTQRLLVVVEMAGGNDGMSMIVPYGMSGYYDLRKNTAIAEADVLAIDNEVGYHPSLPLLHRRGAAVVQGVGSFEGDGSHFEMRERWWQGTPNRVGTFKTGFLGRLADSIGDPQAPATALSVSYGAHPSMISAKAATLTVPNADAASYLVGAGDEDDMLRRFQLAYETFASTSNLPDAYADRLNVMGRARSFASSVGTFDDESEFGYRDDQLGSGLRMAAHLFSQNIGLRIVHITIDGDYDTHEDHNGRYPQLMDSLDVSLDAFMNDVSARGMADRVLVMTTSEFGRTGRDNDSGGLDHGLASNMLMLGPVNAGRFGQHPILSLDTDQSDPQATSSFDQYYATVAEDWFGVPSSEVLDGNVTKIDGIIA